MKKAIVTTTINSPTKALMAFAEIAMRDEWTLIIIGDMKTPDSEYDDFCAKYEGAVVYIDMKTQEKMSQELSDLIGPNCIQRRNFGLIYAYQHGAQIIATVDDDNIPYPKWGQNVVVGKEYAVSVFKTQAKAFDPLSVTHPQLWHRGFPIEELDNRTLSKPQLLKRKILVQADMWDGAPDIDAICRIAMNPQVTFNPSLIHFAGDKMGPFNSQNTFLHRDAIPHYFLFPHIGRMDDIWAGYGLQHKFPDSVCYAKASVFQERNPHDLRKDLEAELIGYRHTGEFIDWLNQLHDGEDHDWPDFMPKKAIQAFKVYKEVIYEIVDNA